MQYYILVMKRLYSIRKKSEVFILYEQRLEFFVLGGGLFIHESRHPPPLTGQYTFSSLRSDILTILCCENKAFASVSYMDVRWINLMLGMRQMCFYIIS